MPGILIQWSPYICGNPYLLTIGPTLLKAKTTENALCTIIFDVPSGNAIPPVRSDLHSQRGPLDSE